MTEVENYQIIHLGEGKFSAEMEDGTILSAGENIRGMIRYTYFEDYSYPPVGWKVSRIQLNLDYFKKVIPEIESGKIKVGQMNH